MATVLAKGTVVTVAGCRRADVRIEGGQVVAIGREVGQPGDTVIDVGGCLVLPGGIDPHTHFDLPVGATTTTDDFASGSKAAAMGGTTTVIDFATQNKRESLSEALANWHAKASGKCHVDYGFHIAVSDVGEAVPGELAALAEREGVTSVKLYMAYKNSLQVDDGALLRVMQAAAKSDVLVCLHCENGDMIDVLVRQALAQGHTAPQYHALTRPAAVEREATFRAICLAEIAGAPLYVVHVSCGGALKVIREARERGLAVYGETCPQYLLLDESRYRSEDFSAAKFVLSPPLRTAGDQEALWAGLAKGAAATVASDHCSFNLADQKELGRDDFSQIPNGGPGVENRFGLLYTYGVAAGKISLSRFVALTATNAAKLFGLYPRKGTIAVGSDADIVVWDPSEKVVISAATHVQRVDYNPYEGFYQQGKARYVFLRGRLLVADGVWQEQPPEGQYLFRKPYCTGGGGVV